MPEEEKESKDWIWSVLALVLLVVGFFVFKKVNQMSHENNYYAYYNDIKGLQASSQVRLKGVRVGKISDIELNGNKKVKVTITIHEDARLLNGTVALLASGEIAGDKIIRLVPGTGPGYIEDEGNIPTSFDTSVMPASVHVTSYLETIKGVLYTTDSTLSSVNQLIKAGLLTSLTSTFIEMEQKTKGYATLAKQLNNNGDSIVQTIGEANNAVSNIAANNKNIKETLNNTAAKTDTLARSSMKDNIQKMRSSFKSLGQTVAKLKSHDSGIGKILDDKGPYQNISNSTEKLNKSLGDLKDDPPGFSILGGKKKK